MGINRGHPTQRDASPKSSVGMMCYCLVKEECVIVIISTMSELRSSLLGDTKKKLDTFDKMYDDCQYRIKKIKQKNDTLQKNTGTELEDEIAVEVQRQKEFIEVQHTIPRTRSVSSRNSLTRQKGSTGSRRPRTR